MPSNWQQCKSVVKECLEVYLSIAEKPIQVNLMEGNGNTLEIKNCGTLDKSQIRTLNVTITAFNNTILNSSKDPCSTAMTLLDDFKATSKALDKIAFQIWIEKQTMKQY